MARPQGRLARARVVHTKHGNAKFSARAMLLVRAASSFVHHFVAVAKDTAEVAGQNERPTARRSPSSRTGSRSTDSRRFRRQERVRESRAPDDAVVVGSVGRLVSEKDYPLLVRAMAPLLCPRSARPRRRRPGAADIEAAIGEPSVPSSRSRRAPGRAAAALFVRLFAMSSRTEGLPLALPEAMTSELPVVATAVGGVPSVVPEEAGVLVPHGDAPALRRRSRLPRRPPPREDGRGRARVRNLARFSEERMMDEYLALYRAGQ